MAGGDFSAYNKVRPGAYVNVVSEKPMGVQDSRGTVLLMNGGNYGWGKNGIVYIDGDTDLVKTLGVSIFDEKAQTIHEALKNANLVKLINFNMGANATAQDKSIPYNISARYAGTRGNDITIDIAQDITDDSKAVIKTIFGTEVVDTQTIDVNHPESIKDNDFVTFKAIADGKFDLDGEHTIKLAGGTSQDVTNRVDVLSDALSRALQSEQYDVATTAGMPVDSKLHVLLAQMVIDLRQKQGYKVTAVVPYSTTKYDDEAVSVIENGVIQGDGTVVSPSVICAWFAGMSASVALNESLTYVPYPSALTASPSLTQDDIIKALKAGHIVFTNRRNGAVVIEQDINSLTTFTSKKSVQFHKNRELRVLDTIANHIETLFEDSFVGSVTNNKDGQSLLKASVVSYFKGLAQDNVIGDFDSSDVVIEKGEADDSVVMSYAITPVDSMEKLYNVVKVTR